MSLRPSSRNRRDGVSNQRYVVVGKVLMTTISRLYYDPARPSAFSTLRKLRSAMAKKKVKPDVIRAWLEKQDAYTLHRQVRKRFARNPYTVSKMMHVWECDLLDVQAYAKYNDKYRYILSVIMYSRNLYI